MGCPSGTPKPRASCCCRRRQRRSVHSSREWQLPGPVGCAGPGWRLAPSQVCYLGHMPAQSPAVYARLSVGIQLQHSYAHESPLPSRSFKGVYDVRQAVDAAEGRRVLHPLVLGAIATTLEAAARLQAQLQQQEAAGSGSALPALQQLGAGIGDGLPQLRQAIEQCIQVWSASCRADLLCRCPKSRPLEACQLYYPLAGSSSCCC